MKNPLFEKAHPFTKIFFLIFIIFVAVALLFVFTLFISNESVESLKILTSIQHLLLFIFPAIIASYIYSKNVKSYLYLNKTKVNMVLFTILIIFLALPIINFTGMINSNLSLPEGLSGMEELMKKLEESAKITTENFLNVNTTGGFIVNIVVIAVLPAIGEELLFRGILLRLLNEWVKNMHLAIILSAMIFSFIHFQFYGFLPRMLLGILFGYLLFWSGSIWLPILAHFINNALAVSAYYFLKNDQLLEKSENFGAEPTSYIFVIISVVFLILTFYLFRKEGKENKVFTKITLE